MKNSTIINNSKSPNSSSIDITQDVERFYQWKAVHRITGLSRTGIWRLIRQNLFPRSRQLSPNRVGWLKSEVDAWLISRPVAGLKNRQEGE